MATPHEVLEKLKQYKILSEAVVSHETLSRRGLMAKQDKIKLRNNATQLRNQLVAMIGENPIAQALLKHILGD